MTEIDDVTRKFIRPTSFLSSTLLCRHFLEGHNSLDESAIYQLMNSHLAVCIQNDIIEQCKGDFFNGCLQKCCSPDLFENTSLAIEVLIGLSHLLLMNKINWWDQPLGEQEQLGFVNLLEKLGNYIQELAAYERQLITCAACYLLGASKAGKSWHDPSFGQLLIRVLRAVIAFMQDEKLPKQPCEPQFFKDLRTYFEVGSVEKHVAQMLENEHQDFSQCSLVYPPVLIHNEPFFVNYYKGLENTIFNHVSQLDPRMVLARELWTISQNNQRAKAGSHVRSNSIFSVGSNRPDANNQTLLEFLSTSLTGKETEFLKNEILEFSTLSIN